MHLNNNGLILYNNYLQNISYLKLRKRLKFVLHQNYINYIYHCVKRNKNIVLFMNNFLLEFKAVWCTPLQGVNGPYKISPICYTTSK